jgi:predicted Zn-dependent protease with MMP-like domain
MARQFGSAPDADEIEAIARAALARLPALFAKHTADIMLSVEEWADEGTLDALGIEDAYDLTGVYEGIPLSDKSIADSAPLPDRIRLFRRAIIDEWAAGGEDLEHLIAHITVHEIGHHFGLSDEAMHALEDGLDPWRQSS